MAKILMLIAPSMFQDVEFKDSFDFFNERKQEVVVASTISGTCIGKFGMRQEAVSVGSFNDEALFRFDALVLIGGPGTPLYRRSDKVIEIVKKMNEKGKIMAAICWAPTILAKAGILKDKRSTVWVGPDSEYHVPTDVVLRKFGAEFINSPVLRDGRIITANGPAVARAFAEEIIKALSGK